MRTKGTWDTITRRRFLLGGSAALTGLLTGCGSGSSNSAPVRSVVPQWNNAALQAVTDTRPGPPITARAVGILHTCMFDAWAAYDLVAQGTRHGASLRRPPAEHTLANKQKAISFAAYRALIDLFPSEKAQYDSLMTGLGYDIRDTSTDVTTPGGIGNVCAAAVLAFRHQDGSNQLGDLHSGAYSDYTGYTPVNTPDVIKDPNRWQPLRFANGASPGYITPQWGNVIPFAMTTGAQYRPSFPLPQFGSAEYRAQAQEILDFTASLDDVRKSVAEYWQDGPRSVLPPGHWCLFAQFVSQRDYNTLDQDIVLFFIVANAVFDASIACWDCKRFYDSCRPITAIRSLFKGQLVPGFAGPGRGIQQVDGANWLPYQSPSFVTPPFPEFTSGHSTFSAAAAQVLMRYTGSDRFGNSVTIAPGSAKFELGVPAQPVTLSWPTFTDAANEAGISRRYGGIHFANGDLMGRMMGRQIGDAVFNRAMSYIQGTAQLP